MSKRTNILPLFLMGALLLSALVTSAQSEHSLKVNYATEDKATIQFKLKEYNFVKEITEEGNFFRISATGYYPSLKAGKPELPVLRKIVQVPAGAGFKTTISNQVFQEVKLSEQHIVEKMLPHQPSVFKNQNPESFQLDEQIYNTPEYFGLKPVKITYLGISRDKALARLDVSPFQYDPVNNKLKVLKSATIEIDFKNIDQKRMVNLQNKGKSVFFQPPVDLNISGQQTQKDIITTTPAKYVIVANSMFSQSLEPFIRWKTQKGFQVVEAYTSDPAVGSTASSIKSYLQSHYDNATATDPAPSFVLLVGDIAQVPTKYGATGSHPTDMYYAEYTGDTIPDAYFGRFSATDTNELNVQIEKTLNYEKFTLVQPGYLNNSVLIAGADGTFGPTHGNGQINYIKNVYMTAAAGFNTHAYLYPNSSSQANQIIQNLSTGFSIANYTAHGLSNGWADPQLYISDLGNLNNYGKYGLMIGNACLTNKFNEPTAFGEAVLRLDNRGAIGYIGGSNNTLWDEDYYWSVGVTGVIDSNPTYQGTGAAAYDGLFHAHGEPYSQWYTTQAQMMFAGNWSVEKSASGQNKYYWEIYHLMGDPSLMPYLGIPDVPSASHPALLPVGAGQLQVTTDPYATVALSTGDSLIGAALSDQSGSALLTFPPITKPGDALLVITSQNHEPYIDTINIVNPTGPYVIHHQFEMNDSLGNDNGLAEYGEVLYLNESIKNYTSYATSNLTAILSSNDTNITIIDSVHSWSSIGANTVVSANNAFKIEIKGNVPDNHIVQFTIEVSDDQNNVWVSGDKLKLHAPNLYLGNASLVEMQGNGNGVIERNETVLLQADLINQGSAVAANVMSQVSTGTSLLHIDGASTKNHGSLNPGATASVQYEINLDNALWKGTIFDIELNAEAGYYKANRNYTFMAGEAMEDFETGAFTKFDWQHSSSNDWYMENTTPLIGNFSARSYNGLNHMEYSELSISMDVMAEDSIIFHYRVSSEDNYDFLEFYVDNNLKGQWSGIESKYTRVGFLISEGAHTFKWIYTKDYGWTEGEDCAWIDNITFPPNNMYSSVEQKDAGDLVEIFPNPATHKLKVLSNEVIHSMVLMDLSGRKIMNRVSVNRKSKELNLREISAGVYILNIQMASGELLNEKVIKR